MIEHMEKRKQWDGQSVQDMYLFLNVKQISRFGPKSSLKG
jgi:hypothetical protein